MTLRTRRAWTDAELDAMRRDYPHEPTEHIARELGRSGHMLGCITDKRFLRVHPRTLLWWREREQCRRCVHYRERAAAGVRNQRRTPLQSCMAQPKARRYPWACIEMRDEGSPCGPLGLLFVAGA